MKRNVHKRRLALLLTVCMLVTLFPLNSVAANLPKPTGLKVGIGETEKTFEDGSTSMVHYACSNTLLGLHFSEVPELDDYYRWDLTKNVVLPNGTTFPENGGGGAVYPFVHLFHWITVNDQNVPSRKIDSITVAFEDENQNKGPSATLNTNITVTQVESSTPVTVYYVGTIHPSWSTDPNDKESTFRISGLTANQSVYFGNPEKSGSFDETDSHGVLEINDSDTGNGWYLGLGDLAIGADEAYYLDTYEANVVSNTESTQKITRHPVNFVFSGFDISVGGTLVYNNGNQINPLITVKTTDGTGATLTEGSDYTVSFEKNGTGIAASAVKNAGTYTVVITGKADTAYEGKLSTKDFTIAKAVPMVPAIAAGLTSVYGKTLADVDLPDGFSWQDADTTKVGAPGTNSFKVKYTPNDTDNYNVVSDISVNIDVAKADQAPVLTLSSATGMKGLSAPILSLSGAVSTGTRHYYSSNPDIAEIDSATGAITILASGTTTFTVRIDGDSNYNDSELSDEVLLTVKDKVDLTVKDTAAIEATITSLFQNQGKISVDAPVRSGLTNDFSVAVSGKTALTSFAAGVQSETAKWFGLLIGNFKVNDSTAYPVTDLFYKVSDDTNADYVKINTADQSASLLAGGTENDLLYMIKSDTDPKKVIWLATSEDGDNEVKLTVSFTPYQSPSHNGGGGGGGGSANKETPAVTTPTTTPAKDAVVVSAKVTAVLDSKGTASVSIPSETMNGLLEKAKAAEAKSNEAVIEINVATGSEARAAEVKIDKTAFESIVKDTKAEVKVETGIGSITFDEKALETINKEADQSITIRIETVDTKDLSDNVKTLIGDRPVYDFTVSSGDQKISSFNGGNAEISVPYTLKAGEYKNAIVVYYVDDSGKLQSVKGAYNDKTGTVDFSVGHFSKYAIGYNKVAFADVSASAWYCEAVTFLAARGITSGTSKDQFSPNAAITRGEFLVMLMRAYGIEAKANASENFADAGNAYYSGYLAAAKQLEITRGTGNNLYQPNEKISRQDMFTLLYRALEVMGEVPEGGTQSTVQFSDSSELAAYAEASVEALVRSGIVSGSNGQLNPKGVSTRAQMAQTLYNLLAK